MPNTIKIPPIFYQVEYKGSRIPGVENQNDLSLGANCQVFAYALLKANGIHAPNLRSKELWEDEKYSQKAETLQPLDILLYSRNGEAFGAHVGVYLGEGKLIHLSLRNKKAEIVEHKKMLENPRYCSFVGAKRFKK